MILLIEGLEGLQEIVKFMSSSDKGNEAGGPSTLALAGTMRVWTMVLVIDFVISFSYTVFPKEAPKQAN
jgi:hypothetical protein